MTNEKERKKQIMEYVFEQDFKEPGKTNKVFIVDDENQLLLIRSFGYSAFIVDNDFTVVDAIEVMNNHGSIAFLLYKYIACLSDYKSNKQLEDELSQPEVDACYKGGYSIYYKKEYLKTDYLSHMDELKESIEEFLSRYEKPELVLSDNVNAYLDNDILEEINQFRDASKKKTGFYNLDRELRGVFPALYVIGAISSLGKTTFASQLADNLLEQGNHVIFFSLEQSRLEMVSKSLARISYLKDKQNAFNSLELRRMNFKRKEGENHEQRSKSAMTMLENSINEYKEKMQGRLNIVESSFNCDVFYIRDYIKEYIKRNNEKPVVFIDYLQILQAVDTHGIKETVDFNITALKKISREFNIPVFVISSVNRSNYLTPIDFESFKESGAIEFTADVILGMQLSCLNEELFNSARDTKIKDKRERVKQAKSETPREIDLVCLKNRFGKSTFTVQYDYYPEFDYFEETEYFKAVDNEPIPKEWEQQSIKI